MELSGELHASAALPPAKGPSLPTGYEAGPGHSGEEKKSLSLLGNEPRFSSS